MNPTAQRLLHEEGYEDAPWVSDIRISREMANETTDVDTLLFWFESLDERIVQMKAFMSSLRDAEIDDEPYFKRSGGALAFAKISSTWVERRLLALGVTPPYPPNDPRSRQLRLLEERVAKLKAKVAELEWRGRDTDGSPEGPDPKGLDGEAATAGAEGIAQPLPQPDPNR